MHKDPAGQIDTPCPTPTERLQRIRSVAYTPENCLTARECFYGVGGLADLYSCKVSCAAKISMPALGPFSGAVHAQSALANENIHKKPLLPYIREAGV